MTVVRADQTPRRRGTFTALGWRWMVLGGPHSLPHLVPATVLRLSRTACQRPLEGLTLSETLPFAEEGRCATCMRANGGVA